MRMLKFAAVIGATAASAMLASAAKAQQVGIGSTKSSVVAQMTAVISKVVSAHSGLQMRPQTMGGTQQYIPIVNAGQLEFGIGNMYQTAQAYAGIGLSKGHAHGNLRMVATLMPFRTGLMVANDSGIKKVADLKGKRVPYGYRAAPLFQNFMVGLPCQWRADGSRCPAHSGNRAVAELADLHAGQGGCRDRGGRRRPEPRDERQDFRRRPLSQFRHHRAERRKDARSC